MLIGNGRLKEIDTCKTKSLVTPAPLAQWEAGISPLKSNNCSRPDARRFWLHQLFAFRPVPGWGDYRTPVKGLYLCGAAAHPGGGVMGACGRNAATAILQD
ncbi:hypothetical protein [Hydrocarboniphaga sp.]|uniref:hypothetical protein n=1 Tax=Hydrocarboniphaga sp. TaxID=2033016 RepID=UPI003D0F771A